MTEFEEATRTAAFFDVDNTLMRGASLYHLARGLARRDFFTGRQVAAFAWKQWKYLTSGKEHLKDLKFVTDASMEFAAGRSASIIREVCAEIVDEILMNKLWPNTLKIAEAHLQAGQEVWLVTASPNELAELLAARIGLTGGLGTVAEVVDDRYTGHILGRPLHGQAKADAVRRLAEERGIDLNGSTAYSDSSNDLPMLNIVGNAVAVNPDGPLRRLARRNDWIVIESRKSRFFHGTNVPANPTVATGAGIAAGMTEAVIAKQRRK